MKWLILLAALPVAAQTGSITGVVRNSDGSPVKAMHVAATLLPIESSDDTAAETETDVNGRFVFATLRPGKYTVAASSADVAAGWTEADVKAGQASDVAIEAGGESRRITGTVRGVASPKAHVIIGRWSESGATMFSAPLRDGRYAIALPKTGRFAIQAVAPGAESETVLLRDETTRDLTLERMFKTAPDDVTAWIAKNAVPLKTVAAGSGFDDMQPIRKIVGDARIVSLGEATHGTKEFFQFKHRMLEYLVANAGFDVFAIEASFPDTLPINEYVTNGTGDPAKAVGGMGFWTWNTEEVLALVKWMRAWNEDPKHTRKLRFYGFDMQNPAASVRLLKKSDPALGPVLDRINPALTRDPHPTAEQVNDAKAALDELAAKMKNAPDFTRHQVTLIHQALKMFSGEATRDAAMAENIRWLLEREPAGTKMVVWAHNGHVATEKYPFAQGGTMGVHLRSMFGKDLVVFGFAFGRGSFQAVGSGKRRGLVEHTAEPLDAGTFDRTLSDAGPPLFVLDLRRATGGVREWLDSPLKNRSIGAMYNDETPKNYQMSIHPLRSFDAIFFIRDMTSAVPIGGRPSMAALPPPPPAAVNLDFSKGVEGWNVIGGAKAAELASTSDGCVSAPCLVVTRPADAESQFGGFMQRFDATPYRGKKIRFRAHVRSELTRAESSARIWLRVDLADGAMGFFDNMQNRAPKSLPEWTEMEIVGDVAGNAFSINLGALFLGSGTAWFDEFSIEVVPSK